MAANAKQPRCHPFALIVGTDSGGNITGRLQECPNILECRKHVFPGEVGNANLDDEAFLASFSLPGQSHKFDMLKAVTKFPRDSRIEFFEEDHYYKIDQVKASDKSTNNQLKL